MPSPTPRRASDDEIVTTRPCVASSAGRAARTTAAVPSRFTPTIRSQSPEEIEPIGAGLSMPAAVTTASRPPWRSAASRTARSVASVSVTSTATASMPSATASTRRSRTIGVPPASVTAATTAAPSPEAPPVTRTRPMGVVGTGMDFLP